MIKILSDKYYLILVLILAYLLFNITLRDPLVNWIYDTYPDKPITDADAYANANSLRNVFSYILFVCLIFIAVISVILLNVSEAKLINKWVLISVPVLIFLLFFCIIATGGFG